MKNLLTQRAVRIYSIMLLIIISTAKTQAQSYTLTTLTDTYTDITGTSLSNGMTWDDPEYTVPIGFDFEAFGYTTSSLEFFDVGASLAFSAGIDTLVILGPDFSDLADRGCDNMTWEGEPGGLSDISYTVDGAVGSRIFKLEWNNAGFFEDINDDNVSSDYVNMQLWLYEGSNIIEYRYGPNDVSSPTLNYEGLSGPVIAQGIFDIDNGELDGFEINGNPSAPSMATYNGNPFTGVSGVIPDGTVYRLTPDPTAVNHISLLGTIKLYPNPTESILHIADMDISEIEKIEIWNMLGQKIENYTAQSELDVSTLNPGLYNIKAYTSEGIYQSVFTKR